jgi:hypothetical protein
MPCNPGKYPIRAVLSGFSLIVRISGIANSLSRTPLWLKPCNYYDWAPTIQNFDTPFNNPSGPFPRLLHYSTSKSLPPLMPFSEPHESHPIIISHTMQCSFSWALPWKNNGKDFFHNLSPQKHSMHGRWNTSHCALEKGSFPIWNVKLTLHAAR